jgi:hypothetical protein
VPELWLRLDPGFRLLPQLPRTSTPPQADRPRPDRRTRGTRRARRGCVCRVVNGVGRPSARRDSGQPEPALELSEPVGDRGAKCVRIHDDARLAVREHDNALTLGRAIRSALDATGVVSQPVGFGLAVPARVVTVTDGGPRKPDHSDAIRRTSLDGDLNRNRKGWKPVLIDDMATLEDAEAARKTYQDRLARMGAHAIEIQRLSDLSGYELIVHFAQLPTGIPSSLVTTNAGRTSMVPVRAVTRPA